MRLFKQFGNGVVAAAMEIIYAVLNFDWLRFAVTAAGFALLGRGLAYDYHAEHSDQIAWMIALAAIALFALRGWKQAVEAFYVAGLAILAFGYEEQALSTSFHVTPAMKVAIIAAVLLFGVASKSFASEGLAHQWAAMRRLPAAIRSHRHRTGTALLALVFGVPGGALGYHWPAAESWRGAVIGSLLGIALALWIGYWRWSDDHVTAPETGTLVT